MSILNVGYGRTDISPKESVPMGGYGNSAKRLSESVLNPLAATCLAFTDEKGETALVYALDLTSASTSWTTRLAPAISKATGIPEDHIFASGSHNHNSPDTGNKEFDSIARYMDLLEAQMIEAANQALTDRSEAKMFTAAAETKGMNFVRRYILEDGTPAGDNYGHFDKSPIKCHESEVDNVMQFVKFVREGKKDIIMVNFQTHPHRMGNGGKSLEISSDIVGVMRDETEKQLGCLFAYFTGGSGNVNPRSRIEAENLYHDHWEHGKAMAGVAVSVEEQYVPVKTGEVKVNWNVVNAKVNHSWDNRLADAKYISENYKATGDRPTWTAEAKKMGFNSVYHAAAIIRHSEGPESRDVHLGCLAIGDVAFAVATYEMFDTNGKYVKENSPFKTTFVLTCANYPTKAFGYVPSALGFKNGGYSTDNCWFYPGAGETFAESLVDGLQKIAE